MNRLLQFSGLLFSGLCAFAVPNVAGEASGQPVTVEYYYKLVPGGMKEWLDLYGKNHHPILKQLVKEGLILSERLYERRFHAQQPEWDYKVVLVWRDWAALEQARPREQEITRALYPNQEEHQTQERRRWELTVEHWDDVLREVPLE